MPASGDMNTHDRKGVRCWMGSVPLLGRVVTGGSIHGIRPLGRLSISCVSEKPGAVGGHHERVEEDEGPSPVSGAPTVKVGVK